MGNSARIGLPYLDAAQAQKHVTMNEALALLDVAAAARVDSMTSVSPPPSPAEGEAHIVAAGAGSDWTGQDGKVAVFLNGGWEFISPWAGWRLWVADQPAKHCMTVRNGVWPTNRSRRAARLRRCGLPRSIT